MSDNINVEAILKKYKWKELRFGKIAMKAAIKEIVEAVVDKQVKWIDEQLKPLLECMEKQKELDNTPEFHGEELEPAITPTQIGALVALKRTKQSILQVKTMIDYE